MEFMSILTDLYFFREIKDIKNYFIFCHYLKIE